MDESGVKLFWDKYKKADYFERKELIMELPFFKELAEKKLTAERNDDETWKYIVKSEAASYFTDIIEYLSQN